MDVFAEIPAMLNYGERLECMQAKQLVASLFVSYDKIIGNRQEALMQIPFMVKHITKCSCLRLKKIYKFSMVTIIFAE